VAGRDEIAAMRLFVANTGVGAFPQLEDLDLEVWSKFEVCSQPAFAFIDKDGSVTVRLGALGEGGLIEAIDALLAT